jgi:hypothetical protein
MRPAQSTMMRSERAKISSSSTETRSSALPASRWATMRLWMNSIAPMSTPRVGCPTSRLGIALDLARQHDLLLIAAGEIGGLQQRRARPDVEGFHLAA